MYCPDYEPAVDRYPEHTGRKRLVIHDDGRREWLPVDMAPVVRVADNGTLHSIALMEPDLEKQRQTAAMVQRRTGVDVSYDPQTCCMKIPGGFQNQKRVAQCLGFDVG